MIKLPSATILYLNNSSRSANTFSIKTHTTTVLGIKLKLKNIFIILNILIAYKRGYPCWKTSHRSSELHGQFRNSKLAAASGGSGCLQERNVDNRTPACSIGMGSSYLRIYVTGWRSVSFRNFHQINCSDTAFKDEFPVNGQLLLAD